MTIANLSARNEYVQVGWDEALDMLASELKRVQAQHGPQGIYGGSYGWSSAGRFHHVQSQLHRSLNTALGGYVRSVNTYSGGCAEVMIPHIFGTLDKAVRRNVTWDQITEHTEIVLAFGGMALKNSRVAGGGVSQHIERGAMQRAAHRGCRFVCISPLRSDLPEESQAHWVPVTPGTDAALMLALAYTLVADGSHDQAFLSRYCTGWPELEAYILGRADGVPKNAATGPDEQPAAHPGRKSPPASRLHSQLDFGGHSQSTKVQGREVCTMHPVTAKERGIKEGDLVCIFNSRGACIAAARLSEQVSARVVQLPTGAWYDPEEESPGRVVCVHGNPNTLTRDVGTSRLAQGCTGQLTIVQVEKLQRYVRPVKIFEPPALA